MSKCNLTRDQILYMTHLELVEAWRKYNRQRKMIFCDKYQLNGGQFSSTLKGKIYPEAIISAIKSYLLELIGEDVPHLGLIAMYGITTEPEIKIRKRYMKTESPLLRVVFVDGDNDMIIFDHLKQISPNDYSADWSTHIVYCITTGNYSSKIVGLCLRDWFTAFTSLTQSKEAVDVALQVLMISMDTIMSANKKIEFVLVTRDGFGKEMISQLKRRGRECRLINTKEQIYSL